MTISRFVRGLDSLCDLTIRELKTAMCRRMVFGQNRQQDLPDYLTSHLPAEEVDHIAAQCRGDLSPPHLIAGPATCVLETTQQ